MKRMLGILAGMLLVAVSGQALEITALGGGQYSIKGTKGFKLQETEHFKIYYRKDNPSLFVANFEKTWKEAAGLLPNLAGIFKTGDLTFQTVKAEDVSDKPAKGEKPAAAPRQADTNAAAFKLTVVFVDDQYVYQDLAVALLPDDAPANLKQQQKEIAKHAPTVENLDDTIRLFWSEGPFMKDKQSSVVFVTHATAVTLLSLNQHSAKTPFWVTAGFGYNMEFKLHKRSQTGYLDYERYYETVSEVEPEKAGNVRSIEPFALGKPWAPLIKKLMARGKKGDLTKVLSAETSNLTPEVCAYIYAFQSYLVSDRKKTGQFGEVLSDMPGTTADEVQEPLLKAYGFKDLDAMQAAWHSYIMSDAFK